MGAEVFYGAEFFMGAKPGLALRWREKAQAGYPQTS